jgi:hypothetical protein
MVGEEEVHSDITLPAISLLLESVRLQDELPVLKARVGPAGRVLKQKVAEIFFFKGNIAKARVRHLSGDDAVFQLFQSPLEGEFSFTGRTVAEEEVQTDITMPAISLLMESVRLQDELPLLQDKVGDPSRVFRQKAAQLQWEDAETVELAAAVWSRLKKGASMNELQQTVPRCSYAVYRTMLTLIESRQVE